MEGREGLTYGGTVGPLDYDFVLEHDEVAFAGLVAQEGGQLSG